MVRALTEAEGNVVLWLSSHQGVRVGLYEVTETQVTKGLVDANETIRSSFAATGFHDYEQQPAGQEAKRLVDVQVLGAQGLHRTSLSLYRPETKQGVFYRLWIYRFKEVLPYSRAGDVVAIAQDGRRCAVVNLTSFELTVEGQAELRELFNRNEEF